MNGRRAIIGLCMLCALLVSAVAAQGASAKEFGTTSFTCANLGGTTHQFTKAHCKESDKGAGPFEHVAIAENTTTELTGTNANTGANTETATVTKLKSVRAGVELELQATGVTNEGPATMVNKKAVNAKGETEMYVEGEGKILYTGVSVTKPAGKGCEVFKTENAGPPVTHTGKGEVETKQLAATTKEQGMALKFAPKAGATFAVFYVTNCTVAGLNGTYEVTGSVKGVPDGATTNFEHAAVTTQGTLKLGGQAAGIEGSLTLKGRANSTQAFTPLSVTTVENT
jgi:hypothetical protein